MALGEGVTVLVTDLASFIDLPQFCNITGNELVTWGEGAGLFSYVIKKR